MRASTRHLVVAGLVTATVLGLSDVAVTRLVSNSVPRQVMRAIAAAPPIIDVLGIGNSLMAAAFDPPEVERTLAKEGRPSVVVNGGLGATGTIEHLALTRLALRTHRVGALVYGYFDQQMADDVVSSDADIIGNRAMLYYQEPSLTRQYARFDLLNRLYFEVHRSSALMRERSNLWARVERMRRRMSAVGMPPEATNQFGRRADFDLLESRDASAFERACERVLQSGAVLAPPVEALITETRAGGARVLVVEMPMHPLHVSRFYALPAWTAFRTRTRAAVEMAGGSYLDAGAWLPHAELYDDHLHLSAEGASLFSEQLARHLARWSAAEAR